LLARVGAEEAIALAATDGPPAEDEAGWSSPTGTPGSSSPTGRQGQEPPRELLGAVLDLTAARRRRRRWREAGLSVAAALIIAVGVFGGLRLSSSPAQAPAATGRNFDSGPGGTWQTAAGQSQGMDATVNYRQVGWGTQLAAKVTGIPIGTTCQMWVVGPGNTRTLVGSWVTDNNEGVVWYPASASISSEQVHEFVITVGKTRSITVAA
jgi:hypothetical protein